MHDLMIDLALDAPNLKFKFEHKIKKPVYLARFFVAKFRNPF